MSDVQALLLYDPVFAPIRRMLSSRDPLALAPGEMALVQNMRWANTILAARDPIRAVTASAPFVGAEFRGALKGSFDSKRVLAYYNPSSTKTEVYTLSSGGTWTDITPDSGKHGDCRFGSSTALNFFSFEVVRDPFTEQDVLVIADPQDLIPPRVYAKPSGAGSLVMAIHEPITPPADSQKQKVVFTWNTFHVAGGSGTMPTYSNSDGANWAAQTSSGSAPNINVQLVRSAASAVAGKTAELQYAVTKDASGKSAINFVVDRGTYPLWLQHLKIEVRDSGGNYSTVYNKPDGIYAAKVIPLDGITSREVWSFSIEHIAAADRDAIDRIRFTWDTTTLPGASSTLNIYAIGFSGDAPGGRLLIGTYLNSDSRAESPRIVYGQYEGARLQDIGGRPLDGIRLPLAPELGYDLTVYFQLPSQAERNKGVDVFRIYASDPTPEGAEEDEFYLLTSVTFATWESSNWNWALGSNEYDVVSASDSKASEERDARIVAPPSFHKPIPKGCTALRAASGRLFASGANAAGSQRFLYGSALDNPFRFRERAIPGDETSPVRVPLNGEIIYGIESQSASSIGADALFFVTAESVWLTVGRDSSAIRDPRRVSPYGSSAPRSIMLHQGQLWFFDVANLQLRRWRNGTPETPSLNAVDTLWEDDNASARLVCLGTVRDRLYVGYTPNAGTANDAVLVYSLQIEEWESNDASLPTGVRAYQFIPGFFQNSILAVSNTAGVYEYDDPTAFALSPLDLGTTEIETALRWPMFHTPEWDGFVMREMEAVLDKGTDISYSTSRVAINGGSQSGTLDVSDAASGVVQRKDVLGSPSGTVRDVAIQPRLSGGSRARKKIYLVRINTDGRFVRGNKKT